MSTLVERVRRAGVVGAGGAGFPAHVKLATRAEWLLANGAECEPLLHKDRELMTHFAPRIVEGMRLAAGSTGAARVHVGIKRRNAGALQAMGRALAGTGFEISEFGDFYPSGDEYEVVYGITGRLIPPGGIPPAVGAVVNNVETLYHVAEAAEGRPVTRTFLTVTGCVRRPLTTWVPVGMAVSEVLELAGGPSIDPYAVMDSGLMMGKLVRDLRQPVTKTTSGLIVLPADHPVVVRHSTPPEAQARIGRSACDQCSYCTELCPRYLLGYPVQPHHVMRSLGYSAGGSALWNRYALLCCGCGICTLYACPENLFPREACLQGIADLRAAGKGRWEGEPEIRVHPMKEYRRVPMSLLVRRLGVETYDADAPWQAIEVNPRRVDIPLKQHAGRPATPVVRVGDRVRASDLLADVAEGELGAPVHASIDGRVTAVTDVVRVEQ